MKEKPQDEITRPLDKIVMCPSCGNEGFYQKVSIRQLCDFDAHGIFVDVNTVLRFSPYGKRRCRNCNCHI